MKIFKKTYLIVPVLLLLTILNGCKKVGENKITSLRIEDTIRHYSPIMQGMKQNISVRVTNTGKEPLLLKNVMPSCGCTVAKFPTYAIAPGNDAIIEMEYDSSKNTGYTAIYTTLTANVPEKSHTIFFDINVVPDSHYSKDYEEMYFGNRNKGDNREDTDEDTHIKAYTINR